MDTFHEQRAVLSAWICDQALPLWTSAGYDKAAGLFHERLTFDAVPVPGLPRRLMVQCRQLYVVVHATLAGLTDGSDLLEKTFDRVVRLFRRPDSAGRWVFSVRPDGTVADPRTDSYSLAFLLFALAWLYRWRPDAHFLDLADEVYTVLDGPLAASGGGVLDAMPAQDGFRRQNPNMHLLEACLALHEAAGRIEDLDRAVGLAGLFGTVLFDRRASALPELHGDGWRPAAAQAAWYEPGHHFEWAWLLRRLARTGGFDAGPLVPALLARALPEGVDAQGFAVERVDIATGRKTASRRCWGTCEYLKACAAEAEADPEAHDAWQARAGAALAALRAGFLATPRHGLWFDLLDPEGVPLSPDVPASSLYHVMLALMETGRVFGTVHAPRPAGRRARQPALFMDRDGVLNRDVGYPTRPSDIVWTEDAAAAVRLAREAGYAVVVVSNQSSVARGLASEAEVMALHRWMSGELAREDAGIAAWYHCPFHGEASNPAYRHPSHPDRKPNPGMLLRAALDLDLDLASSHMIGDKPSDLEAARRAGVRAHRFDGGSLASQVAGIVSG